jgi:hypothetical protein
VLVPAPVQQQILTHAPQAAYAPARLAPGWRYTRWTRQGTRTVRIWFANKAGKEIVFVAAPFRGNCRAGMEKSFQLAGVKVYWGHRAEEQEAWRCVNGMKLVGATSLPPDRFADVGLGRLVASGHRLRP